LTLEHDGYDVIDAQNGELGLRYVQEHKPDLIILDVMMGKQDEGFFVAYEVRNLPDGKDLPIVMLTAVGQETGFRFDKEKDQDFLPVNEFIEKPVSPERLLEVVRTNLGN
jgi:two-component system alkaline phosphatase synthesis response regulator PhoP